MPQLQNLVLTDRQATPVAHTFTPDNISSAGVGSVIESGGVPTGANRFSISHRLVNNTHKVEIRMAIPIVQNETINAIVRPKVVRTSYVTASFSFDGTSSLQERKDVVGMFQSAFDPLKLLVNDTLVNLQGVY